MSRRIIVSIFVVVAAGVMSISLNAHCGRCPGDVSSVKAACAADANQVKVACECAWCSAAKADAKEMWAAGEKKGCPKSAKMNMPMCKMVRGKMAMNAQLQPTDPASLLAIAEQLQLSEEQTTKLNAILENARKETQAVLTEEQMTKVKALGGSNVLGKQMCGKKMVWGKMSGCGKMMAGCCKAKDTSCKKQCPLTAPEEKPAEIQ